MCTRGLHMCYRLWGRSASVQEQARTHTGVAYRYGCVHTRVGHTIIKVVLCVWCWILKAVGEQSGRGGCGVGKEAVGVPWARHCPPQRPRRPQAPASLSPDCRSSGWLLPGAEQTCGQPSGTLPLLYHFVFPTSLVATDPQPGRNRGVGSRFWLS